MGLGACARVERELPGSLPVLYFACRRHKLERDLNSAFRAVFPDPTKAPTDSLCEKVNELSEAGRMPAQLDETCPHVFRSQSAFFKRQRDRLSALAAKMVATGEKSGCLPRDDYRYLLNLVKVKKKYLLFFWC